jgi:RNAse (barnase) inhibitor barstar
MPLHTTPQPVWYPFSHHDRCRRLNKVRRVWFRCHSGKREDVSDRTVHLDGAWINDVPSFYLSLGEAINGPNGYFGGDLDALSDCLTHRFGVRPPLTVWLSHFAEVRNALDGRAWCRWTAEAFYSAVVNVGKGYFRAFPADADDLDDVIEMGYLGDGSPSDIARWTAKYEAALANEPFDCDEFGSYFDTILKVFAENGAALLPEEVG